MSSSCALNWRGIACSTAVISLSVILGIQPARAQLDDAVRPYIQEEESPGLVDTQIVVASQELQRLSATVDDNPALNTDAKTNDAEAAATSSSSAAATVAAPTSPNSPAAAAELSNADGPKNDAPHPQDTAQTTSQQAPPKPYLDIYGFAQADVGYDFKVVDPDWFDVVRPTKFPSVPGEFGRNGNTYFSVRQTRFGVKGFHPTPWGDMKVQFEFDMFGVGVDAGQTTIRPRTYYGEIGAFGAGQTHSPFMDIDVFPNIFEYWGPNGMVFFRNVQVRWMPIRGDTRLTLALERPGASADAGVIANRIEVQNVRARFKWPDVSGEFRYGGKRGYIKTSAIVRNFKLDDQLPDQFNLDQNITAWGVTVSSNVKVRKDTLRLQYVYGEGVENYMNDAPVDVAPELNPGHPTQPVKGKALPVQSWVAFLDHAWSEHFSSSIGYSQLRISNSNLQNANDFHMGRYAIVNIMDSPFENFLYGVELQWGNRTNFRNTFQPHDFRIQFSFKYSFNFRILGKS